MSEVLARAAQLGREGAPAALATVLTTAGSAPRRAGSHAVLGVEGVLHGELGSDEVARPVLEAARDVLAGGPPRRVVVPAGADGCGGAVELWVEPLDGARWKALDEATRRRRDRRPCALVTALDAVGGGGKDVWDDDPCLTTRRARVDGARLIEPVLPPPRLIIFGASDVSRAVAPLAARIGWEVVVCDDDAGAVDEARFPEASARLTTLDVAVASTTLGRLGALDHVLVATRGHAHDEGVLAPLIGRDDLGGIGLLASRKRVARLRERLQGRRVGSPAQWDRLRAPVGLDLGGETPEEIAVEIIGQLIQVTRRPPPA